MHQIKKAGVIDPTKVVRTSLQNAAPVAGLLLTTEAMIADKPEPKGAGRSGGMPGMIQVPDQRLTRPDSPSGGG